MDQALERALIALLGESGEILLFGLAQHGAGSRRFCQSPDAR
jgi:hypothetical protein